MWKPVKKPISAWTRWPEPILCTASTEDSETQSSEAPVTQNWKQEGREGVSEERTVHGRERVGSQPEALEVVVATLPSCRSGWLWQARPLRNLLHELMQFSTLFLG